MRPIIQENFTTFDIVAINDNSGAIGGNSGVNANAGNKVSLYLLDSNINRANRFRFDFNLNTRVEFGVYKSTFNLPNVRTLDFVKVARPSGNDFNGADDFPGLEVLVATFNPYFKPNTLATLSALKTISLIGTDIPINLDDIATAEMELQRLILDNADYIGDPLILADQTELTNLEISNTANSSPSFDCDIFINLTKLVSFDGQQNFGIGGSLLGFQNSINLETLLLTNTAVNGGIDVVQFIPKLKSLDIRQCNFATTQLDSLMQLLVDLGSFFTASSKLLNCASQKTNQTLSAAGIANVDILRNNFGWTIIY